MSKLISTLVVLLSSVVCFAGETQGTDSAITWLEIVDNGEYAESWNQTAPFFQSQLSSKQWEQALSTVRAPLGKLISRQVKNSSLHASLPEAPDGEYVVITFSTSYKNKESSIETVTVSNVGGEWKVVGYFIK